MARKALLVTWDPYPHEDASVTQLVLYRNEYGGSFQVRAAFADLTRTAFVDEDVKKNRVYCYRMAAQTADGALSPFSEQACTTLIGGTMQTSKPIYASKVFWFNAISGALEVIQTLSGARVLPPDIAAMILAGGNVLLRFFTEKPVTLTS